MAFLPQLCSQQQGMMETLCNTFISDNLPHLINHFVISQLVNNFLDPASICQTLRACHRPRESGEVAVRETGGDRWAAIGRASVCAVSSASQATTAWTVPALCTVGAVFTWGLSCAASMAVTGVSAALCDAASADGGGDHPYAPGEWVNVQYLLVFIKVILFSRHGGT